MATNHRAFFGDRRPQDTVALTKAGPLSAAAMTAHARAIAARLRGAPWLGCLCTSRYHVALSLLVALELDVPCLMPHDHSPATVTGLERRFPGARLLVDTERVRTRDPVRLDTLHREADEGAYDGDLPVFEVDRSAVYVFTSGSTGTPTVHAKPWGALAASGRNLARRFAFAPGATAVATVPGQHTFGIEGSMMMPLQGDGVMHASQPLYPADVADALAQVPAPRVLVSTPFHLRTMIRAGITLPETDFILCSTAPMDRSLARTIEGRFGTPVMEIYGCSEAGAVATRRPAMEVGWSPCTDVAVHSAPDGAVAVSPHLPAPTMLADRIEPMPDGRFRVAGRPSDLVNIAGKRGSIGDITAKLLAIDGIEDAAIHVPALETVGSVQRVVAFVVAPTLRTDVIRQQLRESVDPAFLPRPIIRVDELPRNGTGKVPRALLDALLALDGARRTDEVTG